MEINTASCNYEKQALQSALINEIVQAMRGTLVLNDVLQATADRLHISLNVSRCLIFRPDSEQEMKAYHVSEATYEGSSLLGVYCDFYRYYQQSLCQGEAVVLNTIDSSLPPEIQGAAYTCCIKAILIVPLLYGDTYIGGISLHECDNYREWKEDEIAFVKSIGDHCAIAIQQSELYERLRAELEQRDSAEQKFRIAESKYRSIFENAIEGIFQSTKSGCFLEVNPALARICGYRDPKTLMANVNDIAKQFYIVSSRRDEFINLLEKSGSVVGFESEIFRADGEIIWISENARFVCDEAGKMLYYEGTVEDITARKNAEAALAIQQLQLQKSEETNKAILNAIPDRIFRVNRDGIFLFFQDTGYGNDVIGKFLEDFLPGEVSFLYRQNIERALVSGQLQTLEYQLIIGGYVQDFEARIIGCGADEVLVMVRDITNSKKAQDALAKSEAKFRSMIQNSSDIITLFNAEGVIEYESPSVENILGYKPEELIGKKIFDFIHPDDLKNIWLNFNKLIDEPGSISAPIEYRFLHKNQYWCWLESTATNLIFDPVLQAVVSNSRDVSERKKVEKELKKSQKKYEAIFNNCFQFTGLLSPEGIMLEVNQTALDFVEVEAKDVIGLEFWKTPWWESSNLPVSPKEIAAKKRLKEAICKAASGEFIRYEEEVHGGGNRIAIIDFSLKPVYDDSGKLMWLISEGRNISEIKQAQAERDRFFNNSADLMMIASYDGEIKLVNSAWEKNLGYSKKELEGQNYRNFVYPEDLEVSKNACRSLQNNPESVVDFQNRYRCKNGKYRWVSWNAVLFEENQLIYGFGRDITERKHAEDELQKLNEELEKRVEERNHQLLEIVEMLEAEIDERCSVEDALKTSEERFRNLVETTNDFVWEINLDGVYVYASPSVQEILGYKSEEMIGKNIFNYMPKKESDKIKVILKDIFVNQKQFHCLENINQHKNGSLVVLESNGMPVFSNDGILCGYRGINRDITERKQAEKALQDTQLFIQRVADAVPGIIYIYDVVKQRTIYLNNQISLLLGYGEEEVNFLKAEFIPRMMHPEDFAKFEECCKQFITSKDEEVLENEYRLKQSNGEWRWFSSRDTVFSRAEDGSPQQILGTAQDISLRKLSEETLKLRERAIEASSNAIVIVDMRLPDTGIIYVNPAFERMTGYSPQEVLGKNCRFLQGKDRNQPQVDTLRRCIKAGESCTVILRNYRKDGTLFWNELSISPLYDKHNTLTHFIGIQTDITNRKIAEEKLQEARDQLQAVLDAVPGFVSWISYDLEYLGVNRHLAAAYNLNPEEFVGQKLCAFENSPDYTEFMSEFMENASISASKVFDSISNNSERFYLIAAQKYQQGKAAVSVGIDITERKQAEEKLLASLREKEVMLKEIHHRVKNNLQIVSSLLKLQSGYIKDPDALGLFKDSYNRVRSMALIHEKLYRSSDLSGIDASEYIHNLVANLCSAYGVCSEKIAVKIDVEKIAIDIDTAIPCGLIINELVSNSFKYAFPEGQQGLVTINLKLSQDNRKMFVLTVADDGIGLPSNFDLETSDSLGLQLVFNLTEQLGGTIQVSGNKGTFYKIIFVKKREG
ncbi:MAG TPA: PAS domain S-box protein [Halomicronema sp.]